MTHGVRESQGDCITRADASCYQACCGVMNQAAQQQHRTEKHVWDMWAHAQACACAQSHLSIYLSIYPSMYIYFKLCQ